MPASKDRVGAAADMVAGLLLQAAANGSKALSYNLASQLEMLADQRNLYFIRNPSNPNANSCQLLFISFQFMP